MRPSYMNGPDWAFWRAMLIVVVLAIAFITIVTGSYWLPCSWYAGVSIKDAPLRCVEVKP